MAAIMRRPPAWVKMKNLIAARCLPSWPQRSITKNMGTSMSSHMNAKRKRSLARKTPLIAGQHEGEVEVEEGDPLRDALPRGDDGDDAQEAGEGEEGQGKAVEREGEGGAYRRYPGKLEPRERQLRRSRSATASDEAGQAARESRDAGSDRGAHPEGPGRQAADERHRDEKNEDHRSTAARRMAAPRASTAR